MRIAQRLEKLEKTIGRLQQLHRDATEREWVCDVLPRYLTLTRDEFMQLSTGDKIAALLDHGFGHWSTGG